MSEVGISCQACDGLDGEVRVVGYMACEVIGGELIFGVEAVCLKVLGPLRELRPETFRESGVAFGSGDGIGQNEEVAALLDGHLVLFGLLSAAVFLTIGQRVLAEIVRGEGKLPAVG